MRSLFRLLALTSIVALGVLAACAPSIDFGKQSWHEKFDWKAEYYFSEPKVIALCKAIEANDLKEMDRLIKAGADVNAKGKGNMTPLLWAFPDNKPERFKLLLERGADPNVIVSSDFNTRMSAILPGTSVTHMASETAFPKYFDYVFQHGGNPNLEKRSVIGRKNTPLLCVLSGPASNKRDKIQRLVELKSDLDHENAAGLVPLRDATIGGRYDLVLLLLESGANFHKYKTDGNSRLIHLVIEYEDQVKNYGNDKQKDDFLNVVEWLKAHGESFDEARADIKRWKSWRVYSLEKQAELRRREIAKRIAREKRESEVAEQE